MQLYLFISRLNNLCLALLLAGATQLPGGNHRPSRRGAPRHLGSCNPVIMPDWKYRQHTIAVLVVGAVVLIIWLVRFLAKVL